MTPDEFDALICPNLGTYARNTVRVFLRSLDGLTFSQPEPLHRVEYRHLIAKHVLDDLDCYCAECQAVEMTATAVRELTLSPQDPDVIERYLAARRAHVAAVKARADRDSAG